MSALTTPEQFTLAVLEASDAYRSHYPRVDPGRLERAVELALAGAVLGQEPDGCYLVQSSKPGGYYRTFPATCSCSDHVTRGVVCKHSIALRLSLAAGVGHRPIPYAVTAKADVPLGLPCPACGVPATTPASAAAVLRQGCCITCINTECFGEEDP